MTISTLPQIGYANKVFFIIILYDMIYYITVVFVIIMCL